MPGKKKIKVEDRSSTDSFQTGKRTFIAEHTMYPKLKGTSTLVKKENKFIVDWQTNEE